MISHGLNISKIQELVNESKYSKRKICVGCKFTGPTLAGLMNGSDVKISTIVSFAKFFNRPVSYFFDEEQQGIVGNNNQLNASGSHNNSYNAADNAVFQNKIEYLETMLEEKDAIISELRSDKDLLKALLKQNNDL